jgi:hypothetical protein
MHAQIRSKPTMSPADLAAFLQVLSDAGINIAAAGGSDIESGGEFGFALEHPEGDESAYDEAEQLLRDRGYDPRRVEVVSCALDNEPGTLLRCIRKAVDANQGTDRRIRDIAVGVPDADGRIQVQVYSEAPGVDAPDA